MSAPMLNERDLAFYLYELFDTESLCQRERYQDHDKQTFAEVVNTAKTVSYTHLTLPTSR